MRDDLEVLLYGDPTLRKVCRPVESFDDDLRRLVDSMAAAMGREEGIGLAAPQVGVLDRVLIARDDRGPMMRVLPLVNPEIVESGSEKASWSEGCLSLPGITADVVRPVRVRVRYQDLDGREHELEDAGLVARIVQHEADHLDGVLFVDHLPLVQRKRVAKQLRALGKGRPAA